MTLLAFSAPVPTAGQLLPGELASSRAVAGPNRQRQLSRHAVDYRRQQTDNIAHPRIDKRPEQPRAPLGLLGRGLHVRAPRKSKPTHPTGLLESRQMNSYSLTLDNYRRVHHVPNAVSNDTSASTHHAFRVSTCLDGGWRIRSRRPVLHRTFRKRAASSPSTGCAAQTQRNLPCLTLSLPSQPGRDLHCLIGGFSEIH